MSRAPLRYRLLERGTRLLNRLVAPKVQAPATGELYARIYLDRIHSWLEEIAPDGMAGVFDLAGLRDADALEAMLRLESTPGDHGSAARYLLVRASTPPPSIAEGSA